MNKVKSQKSEQDIAYIINGKITTYLWNMWDGQPEDSEAQQDLMRQLGEIALVSDMLGFPVSYRVDPDNGLPCGCRVNGNFYPAFEAARRTWENLRGIKHEPAPEPDLDAIWTPLDEDEDEEEYLYILRDLDGYGSAAPVCVTREEAERLCRAWSDGNGNTPEFDDIWRKATNRDVLDYGITEEDG